MIKYSALLAASLTLSSCGMASAPEEPRVFPTLHIELDNSDSPLASSDPIFARILAKRVAGKIADLPPGHHVSIRTFGDVNGENNLRYTKQLTRKSNPPAKVARDVARLIDKNARSTKPRQGKTEIIFTLTNGEYNCKAGDEILLLSDGIPFGRVRSTGAILEGKEKLPEPKADMLKGCSVAIWSLGRTKEGQLSSVHIENLQSAWGDWVAKTGASFSVIINP